MELKEFVEDTLRQISEGVKSAQSNGVSAVVDEATCVVHFDVFVGSDNLTNAGGRAGAFFGCVAVKGRASKEDKQTLQNKVQFDIPIHLG